MFVEFELSVVGLFLCLIHKEAGISKVFLEIPFWKSCQGDEF